MIVIKYNKVYPHVFIFLVKGRRYGQDSLFR